MSDEHEKELLKLGIQHRFLDSPTLIAAREKIRIALIAISDTGKIDAGMGGDGFDFWVKINGVEYYLGCKVSASNNIEEPSHDQ